MWINQCCGEINIVKKLLLRRNNVCEKCVLWNIKYYEKKVLWWNKYYEEMSIWEKYCDKINIVKK